ncbi:hypothetical protein [Streptomyces sp. NBC_00038]|uniref:hypothetical protein n=1 Tax=Streptomyces sp. NBC_00038 TaxID=2903615 RepID=UPI00225718DA|nr:hypothetical protein [Streptomyces sp. NBC_00038]MCX5559989.1 hypothetical protein [Streptomyces sp. NBC_00038]
MTGMTKPQEEDEAQIIAIMKREWTSLRGSWKAWTEDIVRREYIKQLEVSGAKAEANGAALAANGLNAEVTGIKLEHTFFDPIAELEKRKEESSLRSRNLLPEQLRASITDVRNQAGRAMDKARNVEDKVDRVRRENQSSLEEIADEFEVIDNRVSDLISSLGGI